jgi:hypothetical protein
LKSVLCQLLNGEEFSKFGEEVKSKWLTEFSVNISNQENCDDIIFNFSWDE